MHMLKAQKKEVLSDEAVKELQEILFEEYSRKLTAEEAKAIGMRLISLYTSVLPRQIL